MAEQGARASEKDASLIEMSAADSGYRYLPAFNIDNFLKSNVPNTDNRCYANSTTQLIRMMPELFAALPPYAGERPIGPLGFVRFMHRNLQITDPAKFSNSYKAMIEGLLGECGIERGQQDQSEFFAALLRQGERQVPRVAIPPSQMTRLTELTERQTMLTYALEDAPADPLITFNKDIVNENIRGIEGLRAAPGRQTVHSPLWDALKPHMMFKSSLRYTLTAGPGCSSSHEIPVEQDDEDEAFMTLRIYEFEDKTPIQQYFNARQEQRAVPTAIMQTMAHEPACRDMVQSYIANTAHRKQIDKALKTFRVNDQARFDDFIKQVQSEAAAKGIEYVDITKRDIMSITKELTAAIDRFLETSEYTEWKAKNPKLKVFQHPNFGKLRNVVRPTQILKIMAGIRSDVAGKEVPDEDVSDFIQEFVGKKSALKMESDAIDEALLYPIDMSFIFNKLNKYFVTYISYEAGEAALTTMRFSGVMDTLNLTMVDGSQQAYQPIAFVVHNGLTLNSGHYVTYVYIDEKAGWYLFDDMKYGSSHGTNAIPVTAAVVTSVLIGEDTKPTFILYRRSEEEMNAMLAENTPELSASMAKAANTMFSSEAASAGAGGRSAASAAAMSEEEMNAMLAESTPELSASMANAANALEAALAAASAGAGGKPVSVLNVVLERIRKKNKAAPAAQSQTEKNLWARFNALKGTTKGGKGKKGKKRVTRRFRK